MAEITRKMHFAAPEELTPKERARDTMITACLWAVYAYLWVPFISLLAWALGFEFAYDVMVRAGGARDLLPIMLKYSVAVAFILSAFTVWSLSNRLRFGKLNRRGRRRAVSDENIAEYFRVSMQDLGRMRDNQILRIDLSDTGRPILESFGNPHMTVTNDLVIEETFPEEPPPEPAAATRTEGGNGNP